MDKTQGQSKWKSKLKHIRYINKDVEDENEIHEW